MADETILVQEGDELMAHYLSYTEQSVQDLFGLLDQLAGHQDPAVLTGEFHALAHNIKGMGSSFGFPLMTRVGTSLCEYLRALDSGQPPSADIVSAHLKAMDTILQNHILGDGGGDGRALVKRLEELRKA